MLQPVTLSLLALHAGMSGVNHSSSLLFEFLQKQLVIKLAWELFEC